MSDAARAKTSRNRAFEIVDVACGSGIFREEAVLTQLILAIDAGMVAFAAEQTAQVRQEVESVLLADEQTIERLTAQVARLREILLNLTHRREQAPTLASYFAEADALLAVPPSGEPRP